MTHIGLSSGMILKDRYEILELRGQGAFGAVYKALDTGLDKPRVVAIKHIDNRIVGDARAFMNIKREVGIARGLSHDNIVSTWSLEQWRDITFILMQYVDGPNLGDYVAEQGAEKLAPETVVKLFTDICAGLEYLHRQNPPVIHRDLKPSNILIEKATGRAILTDFGLAREAKDSMSRVSLMDTSGSPPFMAPELWNNEFACIQSDIYALGVMAYELLAGHLPFRGPDYGYQHRSIAPKPIQGISEEVNRAVLRCLEKDAGKRYVAAGEFIRELADAVGGKKPLPPPAPPKVFPKCPVCSEATDIERFTCSRCGTDNICVTHRSQDSLCSQCDAGVKDEAERVKRKEQQKFQAERIEAFLTRGSTFLDDGDYENAIIMFDSALEIDGKHEEAGRLRQKAKALWHQKKEEYNRQEAERLAEKREREEQERRKRKEDQEKQQREKIAAFIAKGKSLIADHYFENAIKMFDSVLDLESTNLEALDLKQQAVKQLLMRGDRKALIVIVIAAGLVMGALSFLMVLRNEKAPIEEQGQLQLQPNGKLFVNSIGQKFEYIPPGTFMMGSPASEPDRESDETQHQVTLTKGYYMQTTEVTQGQWKRIMGNNPSRFKDCGDDCPVERVNWYDAQEFIQRLNSQEGTDKYRLPTEAEWEYAARAGTSGPFAFGACLSTSQANYDGSYPQTGCSKGENRDKTIAAGSFRPNTWGLYDMHGNVWEWCSDRYGDYPSYSVSDPEGPSSGSDRVYRGGSWLNRAWGCRSANRVIGTPDDRDYLVGFRLLCRSSGQ